MPTSNSAAGSHVVLAITILMHSISLVEPPLPLPFHRHWLSIGMTISTMIVVVFVLTCYPASKEMVLVTMQLHMLILVFVSLKILYPFVHTDYSASTFLALAILTWALATLFFIPFISGLVNGAGGVQYPFEAIPSSILLATIFEHLATVSTLLTNGFIVLSKLVKTASFSPQTPRQTAVDSSESSESQHRLAIVPSDSKSELSFLKIPDMC